MENELIRFRLFIIAFLGVFCLQGFSQIHGGEIKFSTQDFNFGHIYEADGHVKINLSYENTGNEPVKISRVIGPGFKSFDYDNDSLYPGEKASFVVVLDPFYKAGAFNKKVVVFSNAVNSPSEININGKILQGSFSDLLKYKIGSLAFKHAQLNFGYVFNGQDIVRYVPVMNIGSSVAKIQFYDVPSHISFFSKFDSLNPGQRGMIEVKYNTNQLDDWDFVIDKIRVETDDEENSTGYLSVTANIREDFSLLSEEEKVNTPKAFIPVQVFNFDTIPKNKKTFYDFLIRNNGERALDIRAIKPTCGCTAVFPDKNSIPPGDSTYIRVAFDSEGYSGQNKKGVTVITNDPENYKQFLWVTGYVE